MISLQSLGVTLKPIAPLHQDSRGWIINATGKGDNSESQNLKQPRLLKTAPAVPRGNHYHPNETETIIFLNNTWHCLCAKPENSDQIKTTIDATDHPMLLTIPPKVTHVFINLSDTPGFMFHFSDTPYTMDRSVTCKLLERPS